MAPSALTPLPIHRPLTTKEISERAKIFQWNPNIPIKNWLRTAGALRQEGQIYLIDQNFPQAYLLYMRYLTLLMDYLPSHPESKQPEAKKALIEINKSLPNVATDLEKIKPIIQEEYDAWVSESKRRETEKKQIESASSESKSTQGTILDPALSSANRILDASDNQDLAVELAQREMRRRDRNKNASRAAGNSLGGEKDRRTAGFWENWTQDLAERQAEDEEVFRMQMESTRRKVERDGRIHEDIRRLPAEKQVDTQAPWAPKASKASKPSGNSKYQYPSISKPQPVQYEAQKPTSRATPVTQPPRPPKEDIITSHDTRPNRVATTPAPTPLTPVNLAPTVSAPIVSVPAIPTPVSPAPFTPARTTPARTTPAPVNLTPAASAPARPAKRPIEPEETLLTPETSQELPAPTPPTVPPKERDEPPKKQMRTTFKPSAYLENGEPLRSIFLPSGLRSKFLDIAEPNTKRGVETAGILLGTAVNNALFVSCLLIPQQSSTSDTCDMENENALLEYCITHDLLQLGWIHTHPTQTCFMSSRDLHTQCGFQTMLPESIAIVCAPKYEPSFGIFRITDPPGLQTLLKCKNPGIFHEHSVDNLYTTAGRPTGHVYEHDSVEFYVKDLRPNGRSSNYNSHKKF
ncbi:hypothetical protein F5Y04DRAFT_129106 [Hypomontagnella monticulosa]|nr:hypothetical protein F5Y04DRAFT_129106 [Hypomontagnella monticulosa]